MATLNDSEQILELIELNGENLDHQEPVTDQGLLQGVEKVYSTNEAAAFFGRTNQWLYWGMREKIFTDVNGNLIEPVKVGKGGRNRFTLPIIREMALSCYRRGNLKEPQLREVFKKILIAEYGAEAFATTEPVEVVEDDA